MDLRLPSLLRHAIAVLGLSWALAAPLTADTFHLISPTAAGFSPAGQTLITNSLPPGGGFNPLLTLTGTPTYWYGPPVSGSFAAGTWGLIIWSGPPGCSSMVTGEIGYANTDGSGYVSLGIQSLDFNQAGNHPNGFTFTVPFLNLVNKVLRVTLTQGPGCANNIIVYNAGDFDSRLATPAMGPNGTATVSPTVTNSPTATVTPVPPLVKSVNATSALVGETLTYTINYKNPNPPGNASCGDTFESGNTQWPSGWSAPTGGTWSLVADNSPFTPPAVGSQALDAQTVGGYMYTTIGCAKAVTDGQIQVDAKILTALGEMTILWRQNGSSSYQLHVIQGPGGANVSLRVITNGSFQELAVASVAINLGQWYRLALQVTGFNLAGYVNGVQVISATDPNTTFASGNAGLEIDDTPGSGMHAEFDDVLITQYQADWYGVTVTDTLPSGLTYLANGCGGSAVGQVVSLPLGTLTAGTSGSCSILAVVNACPGTLANQADFHVNLPLQNYTSNSVSTTVSCATATPTVTRTSSPTPSGTATPSATPSDSPSPSPSRTASPTATPSPSRTATPSASPSATQTATPSPSPTATPSASPSPSRTATPTATPSPSPSSTPSTSPTLTPSPTRTASPSVTATPSVTPIDSPTTTPTASPSATATPTVTLTATASDTPSDSPTPTASSTPTATPSVTLTATASATASASPSESPSSTPSPTASASPTCSPSPSASPSNTPSPTITATPRPYPAQLDVSVYNSAGERVRIIYQGPASKYPSQVALSQGALIPGLSVVTLQMDSQPAQGPLVLAWDGSNDQGQPVASGSYYVKVDVTDPFGQVSAFILPVQALGAPGAAASALDIYNPAGERVASLPLSPSAGLSDLSLLNAVVVPGQAPGLQVAVQSLNGFSYSLHWNGLNSAGAAVASGTYTLRPRAESGSTTVKTLSFTVLDAPATAPLPPLLAPNPAPAGATTLQVQAPASGQPWSADLYSLSGARILHSSAPAGVGLALPLDHFSAGLYFVEVRTRDSLGRAWRWTLKAAIVR